MKDYKFFCFNGKVEVFKIDFGRFVDHHANYYDRDGKLLDFGENTCPPVFEQPINIPSNLYKMEALAESLATVAPFVRVDFYNVSGKIYFGEITFFPASGVSPFTSEIWDEKLGNMLVLKNDI